MATRSGLASIVVVPKACSIVTGKALDPLPALPPSAVSEESELQAVMPRATATAAAATAKKRFERMKNNSLEKGYGPQPGSIGHLGEVCLNRIREGNVAQSRVWDTRCSDRDKVDGRSASPEHPWCGPGGAPECRTERTGRVVAHALGNLLQIQAGARSVTARWARTADTHRPKLIPVSDRNTRVMVRGLTPRSLAQSASVRMSLGSSPIASTMGCRSAESGTRTSNSLGDGASTSITICSVSEREEVPSESSASRSRRFRSSGVTSIATGTSDRDGPLRCRAEPPDTRFRRARSPSAGRRRVSTDRRSG